MSDTFSHAYLPSVNTLVICHFMYFIYFLIGLFVFAVGLSEFFICVRYVVCKYFLLVYKLWFHPPDKVFCRSTVFIFDEVQHISISYYGS